MSAAASGRRSRASDASTGPRTRRERFSEKYTPPTDRRVCSTKSAASQSICMVRTAKGRWSDPQGRSSRSATAPFVAPPSMAPSGYRTSEGRGRRRIISKLPATLVLGDHTADVPEVPLPFHGTTSSKTFREIWYEESEAIGYVHFSFYNGAMATDQCRRLTEAVHYARGRPTRVIVLFGGPRFLVERDPPQPDRGVAGSR